MQRASFLALAKNVGGGLAVNYKTQTPLIKILAITTFSN